MKKAIIFALCLLLIPAVTFAMQPISEAEMDGITGQSGVSIVIDDVQIYQHLSGQELWYQDTSDDGASVGFVYDTDSYSMIYVNAITPDGDDDGIPDGMGDTMVMSENYVTNYDFSSFTASAMTIDVTSALTNSTALNSDAAVAGVAIGLPTVEIYFAAGSRDVMDIQISTAGNPLDGTTDQEFSMGKIYQTPGDQTMAVLGGNIEISPNEAW